MGVWLRQLNNSSPHDILKHKLFQESQLIAIIK